MESPHSKKLWAVLIPAMFLPGLASLWYFVWLGDSPLAQVIYGSVKFFTLIWPIITTFLILKEKIHFKELSIREHLKSIPMGVVIGLPIAMVIGLLMLSPVGDVVKEASPMVKQKCIDLGFLHQMTIYLQLVDHFYPSEYLSPFSLFGKKMPFYKLSFLLPSH